MVAVKERLSGSWLDVKSSGILGAKLRWRLLARLKGEKAVFVTLTYERREGETPEELFRRSSEERHVRKFIERLSRVMGQSLTGRWICKLEFQRGGWVHWHLIIVGCSSIPHRRLAKAWSHGHVWVQRCTKARVKYFAKYIAKGGNQNVPGWLYGFASRSVKVIRVSPGFWPKVNKHADSDDPALAEALEYFDEKRKRKRQRKPSRTKVAIGHRLEEGRGIVVRAPDGSGKMRYQVFQVDLASFLWEMDKRCHCAGGDRGWLRYAASMEVAEAAAAACQHRLPPGSGSRASAAGEDGTAEGLHLSVTSNPPGSRRAAIERRRQWERENSYHGWTAGEGPPEVLEWWEELEVLQEHWEEQRIKGEISSESPEWVEVWTPGDRWVPHEVRVELEREGLL